MLFCEEHHRPLLQVMLQSIKEAQKQRIRPAGPAHSPSWLCERARPRARIWVVHIQCPLCPKSPWDQHSAHLSLHHTLLRCTQVDPSLSSGDVRHTFPSAQHANYDQQPLNYSQSHPRWDVHPCHHFLGVRPSRAFRPVSSIPVPPHTAAEGP